MAGALLCCHRCAPACSSGKWAWRTGEWKARPRVSSSRTKTPSAFSTSSNGFRSSSGPATTRQSFYKIKLCRMIATTQSAIRCLQGKKIDV